MEKISYEDMHSLALNLLRLLQFHDKYTILIQDSVDGGTRVVYQSKATNKIQELFIPDYWTYNN